MSLVKNFDYSTSRNPKNLSSKTNINELLGIAEKPQLVQLPALKDSDDYVLEVIEATQINLRKKAISFEHNFQVNSVAFSRDGKYVASGSNDKIIKIWNLADSRAEFTLTDIPNNAISFFSNTHINNVLKDPSNSSRINSSKNSSNFLEEPLLTPSSTVRISTKLSEVKSVAVAPNGKFVAGGLDDGRIIL